MSNIHYTKLLNTISDVYDAGKIAEVICLENRTENWNGQQLNINEKELINFGTCSYLGLETDRRLIDRSMEYTNKFGTHFSVSRSFLISSLVTDFENHLSEVFDGQKLFVFSSTSLAHISVLPIIIGSEDAIIFDKQVHFSVQNGAMLAKSNHSPVMVKHNNMTMLERTIERLKDSRQKIWYMIDGVYSMFGDFPPLDELNALMSKYEQLHLYVDDAHGMAWAGKKGAGTIFNQIKHADRLVLATTMAKGFGSVGGIVVFPDEGMYNKVKKFGGPLSYSHTIPPAIIGAGMAATDILLSEEITTIQNELTNRISYCNQLLADSGLPILSHLNSPIKFIGIGDLETGFKFNKKVLDEGYFVNMALFPTVAINNTGMRFILTRHVTINQIHDLVEVLKFHYFKTLEETGTEIRTVQKFFKLPLGKKILLPTG